MEIVKRESGVDDLIVRPLCAKNLPESIPEQSLWINRSQLFGFSGRSRKPQIKLAEKYGFEDYAQPAGGCCFLTDQQYSNRLQDFWDSKGCRDYEFDDILLLKIGRHIRPCKEYKLIIARDDGESRYLSGYKKQFVTLQTINHTGPFALVYGELSEGDAVLAASIVARYSKGKAEPRVSVEISSPDIGQKVFDVVPIDPECIDEKWII
jgi:hypothetical protein